MLYDLTCMWNIEKTTTLKLRDTENRLVVDMDGLLPW